MITGSIFVPATQNLSSTATTADFEDSRRKFSEVAFYTNPISGTKRQLQNASEHR